MNRNKLRDMQKSDILDIKKLIDEHGYLRTGLYYVCKITEDGTRELTFNGTLFELSTCKYDPNSRYTLKNYQLDTVVDNMNGLELKLKIKELIEHES